MTRLIDADALEYHIVENPMVRYEFIHKTEIDNAPTIDPLRHGRWIENSYDEYTCSVCGKNVSDEIFYAIRTEDRESASMGVANYCPNCGAKMDGESDE